MVNLGIMLLHKLQISYKVSPNRVLSQLVALYPFARVSTFPRSPIVEFVYLSK